MCVWPAWMHVCMCTHSHACILGGQRQHLAVMFCHIVDSGNWTQVIRPPCGNLLSHPVVPTPQFLRRVLSITLLPIVFDLLFWSLLIYLDLQASESTLGLSCLHSCRTSVSWCWGFWAQALRITEQVPYQLNHWATLFHARLPRGTNVTQQ